MRMEGFWCRFLCICDLHKGMLNIWNVGRINKDHTPSWAIKLNYGCNETCGACGMPPSAQMSHIQTWVMMWACLPRTTHVMRCVSQVSRATFSANIPHMKTSVVMWPCIQRPRPFMKILAQISLWYVSQMWRATFWINSTHVKSNVCLSTAYPFQNVFCSNTTRDEMWVFLTHSPQLAMCGCKSQGVVFVIHAHPSNWTIHQRDASY